jgi:hypothetical protein
MDVIDVVIELALAGTAVMLAGMLLLRGRHGSIVTVRGRTVPRPATWASALLLVGVVLALRVGIDIVPTGWQPGALAAIFVAATACLAVTTVAITRSRRP